MTDVVTAYPRRLRRVVAVTAAASVVTTVALALLLDDASVLTSVNGGGGAQQRLGVGDRVAIGAFGFLVAGVLLMLGRPRVVADTSGITVRNVGRTHRLPWQVVRGIRFDRHVSWAVLHLQDDETLPVLAVQYADGASAAETVDRLRALHAAAVDPPPPA